MQYANILLSLAGDNGNQVSKDMVTPAEVAVLRVIHGDDAVTDIDIVDEAPISKDDRNRTSRAERQRLLEIYARPQPDGSKRAPAIDLLFPGVAARVYEDFDELELDDSLFKAERVSRKTPRKVEQREAEKAEKSLDDMSKAELVAYAKANEIDVNASAKKDDILIAIRDAEEAQKSDDADDDADDGIGEIKDDAADQNLFQ